MLSNVTQLARTNLSGHGFLDVLTHFQNQPLAVLHSGHNQSFSVIATHPLLTLTASNPNSLQILTAPDAPPISDPPTSVPLLAQFQSALNSANFDSPHHPLTAWIGQFSYDLAYSLESIGTRAKDDLHWPLLHWQLFDHYYLFDHAAETWSLVTTHWRGRPGGEKAAQLRLDRMLHHIADPLHIAPPKIKPARLLGSMPRAEYLAKVQRIKEYIAAGDIFQANFAQRWSFHTESSPIDIFRQLMIESPAPYAALFVDKHRSAISASPELFLHRLGHHLVTRPIKGTRPRDLENSTRDQALRDELLHSEKEKAELAMIVDLLRNDLGRLAHYGSVHVTNPREIEAHPTVWHAVATIEADLVKRSLHERLEQKPDPRLDHFAADWPALITALLPGGSVTGAPKIRATQIIDELEPTRRGLYCGTLGAIASIPEKKSDKLTVFLPTATLNIAIRTIQLIQQTAHVHAGGAITADSHPESEYEETLHKSAALFRALNVQ